MTEGSRDGRRRNVTLTDAGRALLTEAHVAMDPDASRAFEQFDDAELTSLLQTLRALGVQLDRTRSSS